MDTEVFRTAFTNWLQKSQDSLIKSDWKTVAKDYPFMSLADKNLPYTAFNKKLKFCRVCLVTGGALYLREKHQPFAVNALEGDFSFRAIPRQIFKDDIENCHEYIETRYSRQDINVLFPLDRLKEFEEHETIGELAERNFSLYDFVPQADRIPEALGKPLAETLVQDEIDVAIFLPVCELGHQTMAMVQREVEARGVTTVMIASQAKALARQAVPRAVVVNCPEGAPLGEPGSSKKQRELLQEIFKFISSNSKPGATLTTNFTWNDPYA